MEYVAARCRQQCLATCSEQLLPPASLWPTTQREAALLLRAHGNTDRAAAELYAALPRMLRSSMRAAMHVARPGSPPNICARVGDLGERRRIGAGHPDLRAERCERIVQRGAAAGIEMGDDFVEQQQRRDAASCRRPAPHAPAPGRSAAPSARRSRRRAAAMPFRAVEHLEIGQVRTVERCGRRRRRARGSRAARAR